MDSKCEKCGNPISETINYCSICGKKISLPRKIKKPILQDHWSNEKDYGSLLKYPEVRELISESAKKALPKLTAEEFTKIADLVLKPTTGIPLEKICDILLPISKKYGIGTGKSYSWIVSYPVSEAIVRIFCSLAKNGYPLKEVQKANNGLLIIAQLPSDIWTVGGTIMLMVEASSLGSRVEINVKIEGQLLDWGKSKAVIKKIIIDIEMTQLR